MTDFETATIAFQEATIAFQNASLWAMYAQAGVAGVVGLTQCGLIAWGIRAMRESNKSRDAVLEALKEQSAGIRALLERTG